MSAPHAFMRRTWPSGYGCGDYCIRNGRGDRVVMVPTIDHYHGSKTR